MITLVYDTETTGVPPKGPMQLETMPYVIQLAAILYEDQRPVAHMSTFIRLPDGVRIPEEKFFLENGLTNERVAKFGGEIHRVLDQFFELEAMADRIVAHNAAFDNKLMDAMLRRAQEPALLACWREADKRCTMLSLVDVLKIPGKWRGSYKWPRLDEAYKRLVDVGGFEGAHDALVDVQACAEVLWKIEEYGYDLAYCPIAK